MDKVSSGGVDRIIPPTLIARAKGLAILSVIKAGFLVTARAGTGIVVAKCSDGTWSAPSAIATAGLGGGFEIGAEITDFVFILNSQNAVDAFSKGGNLTLGGNLSVAVGPIGRHAEADVAVRSPAAIYTYSRAQGLFAGISLVGSGIFERKEANRKMYGKEVRSKELLDGRVPPPDEAHCLYAALKEHVEGMLLDAASEGITKAGEYGKAYAAKQGYSMDDDSGSGTSLKDRFSGMSLKRPSGGSSGGGGGGGRNRSGSGGGSSRSTSMTYSEQRQAAASSSYSSSKPSGGGGGGGGGGRYSSRSASSLPRATSSRAATSAKRASFHAKKDVGSTATSDINAAWDSELTVQARWDYTSDRISDLSFRRGDKIVLLTRTNTQEDWWEGKLRGKVGIFPANYVTV